VNIGDNVHPRRRRAPGGAVAFDQAAAREHGEAAIDGAARDADVVGDFRRRHRPALDGADVDRGANEKIADAGAEVRALRRRDLLQGSRQVDPQMDQVVIRRPVGHEPKLPDRP
jgi:hypothetical protein